jgi:hypothetical protein
VLCGPSSLQSFSCLFQCQQQQLSLKFNLCNQNALEDVNNRIDWAGNGVIYVPAQSNDPACKSDACDIRRICSIMTV